MPFELDQFPPVNNGGYQDERHPEKPLNQANGSGLRAVRGKHLAQFVGIRVTHVTFREFREPIIK